MLSDKENELFLKNLSLVKLIANKYKNGLVHMEYDDLVQAGSIGLMEAIQHFDETLGYKFSTFAYPYIEGHIINEMRDSNTILRVPYKMQHEVFEYRDLRSQTGITMMKFATERNINPSLFLKALHAMAPMISIDEPIAHSSEYLSLFEVLSDNNISIETMFLLSGLQQHIDELFRWYRLTDIQKTCIKLYYGFEGKPKTYREISGILNLSPSYIQQIVAKGLRLMRLCESHCNREGQDYLDILSNINTDAFI